MTNSRRGEELKRNLACGIALISLLIGTLLLAFDVQPVSSDPTTWTVDDDGPADFHTIQEAINSPSVQVGDTIFVKAGTYYEHVVVNKTVSLVGEGPSVTAIDGNRIGRTVVVTADNVTISNLRIEKSGLRVVDDDCNIFINGSGTKILSNDIINAFWILVLIESSFNTIEYNNIMGGGRGILLGTSTDNTIAHNYIDTSGLLTFGSAVSSYNTIHDNYIKNRGGGWPLIVGGMNDVINNTIALNTVSEGFSSMRVAGSLNNITGNNVIVGAVEGVTVFGINVLSSNNAIYHNNFFNYTLPALIEGSVNNDWDNGYPSGGNYWSDYAGTDLNSGPYQNETGRDGIGDTAHIFDENNRDNYPLIYPHPCATMPWDITGQTPWLPDGTCDTRDIATVASLYGSVKGDGKYDNRADITGTIYLLPDDRIDIRDIALTAKHFGETYP